MGATRDSESFIPRVFPLFAIVGHQLSIMLPLWRSFPTSFSADGNETNKPNNTFLIFDPFFLRLISLISMQVESSRTTSNCTASGASPVFFNTFSTLLNLVIRSVTSALTFPRDKFVNDRVPDASG